MEVKIIDYGDSGILIEYSKVFTKEAWVKTHYLANQLRKQEIKGVLSIVPTLCSIFIHFNYVIIERSTIKAIINQIMVNISTQTFLDKIRRFQLPVVYGGKRGTDISTIASQLKMSQKQVIHLFNSKPHQIMCFARGPMMDNSIFNKKIRRLEKPRTLVPTGSIVVANNQASIISMDSPSGWQVLGQTPIKIFDPLVNPPGPFKPGDLLEFFSIKEEEFNWYKEKSIYELEVKL